MIRECLMSEELAKEWAEHFRGKSKEELDDLAKSFAFGGCGASWRRGSAPRGSLLTLSQSAITEHCKQRKELNEILRRHSGKTVQ
jgi:hypothetical protein